METAKKIDLSQVSTEDLEAALKAKKKDEQEAAIKRRGAYEGIRKETCETIETKVRELAGSVREFYKFITGETKSFYEILKEYGQLTRADQMNYKIQSENFRVEVVRNKVKKFDERADAAASRLIDFLRTWISQNGKGEDDPMYQLAMTLLERNRDGDLDYKSISKLYGYEQKFNDPEYSAIMQLFKESNTVEGTATNFYFSERTDLGVWKRIEVNFNRL